MIVISEHWLWPFELHRLGEVHLDFEGVGQADRRLGMRTVMLAGNVVVLG